MKKTPDNPILTVVKGAEPLNDKGEIDKFGDKRIGPYFISHGKIGVMLVGHDRNSGQVHDRPTELTLNFCVLITEQLMMDDGIKTETVFVLEGRTLNRKPLPIVTINASQFPTMAWTWRFYGGRALISPNAATPRQLSVAIVTLSDDYPITTVYQHGGWRKINDQWCYLTGSGAIGRDGLNTDIRVELGEGNMQRYALLEPREDPREIARILFSLLELAPKNKALGVSLFCCVIRAVFGECLPTDFTLFLSGKSGSQKSECAALALGCFGKFNARNFPANFTDTDSDLEYKAHQAKDSVFVIDDYVPGINLIEANKTRSKGANIIRGAGNQAGRGRRNTDMSGKSAYYPRGMNIITGEDSTAGSSLLARQLIIEIKQGDVNLSFLTALQLNSSRGELAACMATFIKWLAPKMDELKKTYPEQVRDTRDKALQEKFVSSHARAGDIYASLYTAANIYIDYAVEVGAIGEIRANDLAEMIENSLKEAVRAQSAFQMQSDEVERFLDLVRAGFSSGECHVCDVYKQGPPLQSPHVWGWHSPTEDADPVGCGQLIGWINQAKSELYLEPDATYKMIQRYASAQNAQIHTQKSTLWKRLLERNLITATEIDKKSGTIRPDPKRTVNGKSIRVLVFNTSLILGGGDD